MLKTLGPANDANLLAVSRDMGQLLIDGIHTAPITSAYYSSVAAAMIQADKARNGGRYAKALTSAFVGRAILAVHSAMEMTNAPAPVQVPAELAMGMVAGLEHGSAVLLEYSGRPRDEAYKLGHGQTPELPVVPTSLGPDFTVGVHKVEGETSVLGFSAVPAVFGETPHTPPSAEEAANSFLEDLIQTGRLDVGAAKGAAAQLSENNPAKTTHILVPDPDNAGALVLKRKHFECGFCESFTALQTLECV